ncbi:MAG TPA: phosphoribosylanthranilate isomerase [Terriglobia bacterium]|nr:phosphoribosylanthranilate isomerase [Terriglobia bacterium]
MKASTRPRLKICCISSVEEAELAIAYGADALGLVSEMPSGPGVIAESLIERIVASVPPLVGTFLLTSRRDAGAIIAQQKRAGVDTLQLVDRVEPGCYSALRAALPGVRLVQVIHVTGPESLEEAAALALEVDALLLDSGNPAAAVKELGGTGRVHDWTLSARIREVVAKPVFLAGGLNSENLREAFAEVRPFAFDVCSGVRTAGRLDQRKLAAFSATLRSLV